MRAAIGAVVVLAWTGSAMAAPAGSLTLNDAYRMALAQSEQVQEAIATRDIADANYTDVLTTVGPKISAAVTANYQNAAIINIPHQKTTAGQQPPYNTQVVASLIQPVFRRQIWDQRRAAHFGIDSSEAAITRAKQQLMFDVTTAFIGVMQTRQQYIIAQEAVKRAAVQLQSAEQRVKVGGDVKASELLAQVDLNRAQIQLNTADGLVRIDESRLQRLIAVPPPETLMLPPTPKVEALSDAIEESRKSRPDLKALRYATLQALANVSQLQDRLFWPTVDASFYAGYVLYGIPPATGVPEQSVRYPTYGILGTFTVPLFQGGDEFLQIRLQRHRVSYSAAQESYQWRQAQDDIREANSRLEIARKGMEIANEQDRAAQQNWKLTELSYRLLAGKSSLLDLVTAQAAVFEAQTNYVLSFYAHELAVYQLLFAEGKIEL